MWWFVREFKEEEKKELRKKKRKKNEEEKESVKKKKIKMVLIKFWEVKFKEEVLLWRRGEKKKCWMKIPKRVDIPTNPENTYYSPLPIFISFSLLLPYIMS